MRKFALFLATALIALACGSPVADTTGTAPPPPSTKMTPTTGSQAPTAESTTTTVDVATGFPVAVAGAQIPDRPIRIVSMSATSTEILFAIGGGDQVVAVDSFSNHPPQAPVTDLSAFEPSVEAISTFEPDLVIISFDPGDLATGLDALGVPVINHGTALTIDDAYAQIAQLGEATGNVDGATELIVTMQADIAALVEEHRAPEQQLTFYHEVDDTFYSATSQTFIGSIYGLFGLANIADLADPDGFGFPQLSPEYIIEADPDLIFYGCARFCGTNADSIAQRPGWNGMTAIQNGAMVELDDDIVSRWGPRLVEFVRLIGESLDTLLGANA